MKELSIEEKAKAYDELFAKAKTMMVENTNEVDGAKILTKLFPQLVESDDERIREALKEYFINSFQNNGVAAICGVHIKKILAWLEKQGEQKPVEWSAYDKATLEYIIEDIKELCDNETEEGSIETYNREINLLQAINESIKLSSYTNPAAWSEEDESWFKEIELMCLNFSNDTDYREKFSTWLKSLKERYTWKPSDEQMAVLNEVINYAANSELQHWSSFIYTLLKSLREQLKKLREK